MNATLELTRQLIRRRSVTPEDDGCQALVAERLAPESISFEQSLYTLIQTDKVTREDALAAADSQNNLLWFINNAGKPKSQPAREPRLEAGADASFSEFTLNI